MYCLISFETNNCRFCKKVFCCKKCREKHELKIHDVFPDCDICVYGQTFLRMPTDDLLNHIKDKHWPLHCVNCNRIFGVVEELVLHNKCPLAKVDLNLTKTPSKLIIGDYVEKSNDFETPPIHTTPVSNELLLTNPKFNYLTTSTPRTPNNESPDTFGVITPSDAENKLENYTETTDSNTTDVKDEKQNKRRVTFNETPLYDSFKTTQSKNHLLKSSLKKSVLTKTPETSATMWETASVETPDNVVEDKPIVDEKYPNDKCIDHNEYPDDTFDEAFVSTTTVYDTCEPLVEDMTFEDIAISNIAVLDEVQKIFEKSQKKSIWTSMTCLVKSIVTGFSVPPTNSRDTSEDENHLHSPSRRSYKRLRLDDTAEPSARLKKMKLTDIRCRKPINNTMPYQFYVRRQKPKCSDKATQTD